MDIIAKQAQAAQQLNPQQFSNPAQLRKKLALDLAKIEYSQTFDMLMNLENEETDSDITDMAAPLTEDEELRTTKFPPLPPATAPTKSFHTTEAIEKPKSSNGSFVRALTERSPQNRREPYFVRISTSGRKK